MKVAHFPGRPELREVQLTSGERATLARASRILFELRELMPADGGMTTDVALAAHVCVELGHGDPPSIQPQEVPA